jgi:N-methylhydantoinase B
MITARGLDPISLEVLWNRLLSVVNEQQMALMRTAFSTIVRESQDLACGVFDPRGAMIAQSITGTPGHINAMATGVIHMLRRYPAETLLPGDVLITNDPWLTAGQINDLTVLTPVWRGGAVVAYFANTCHAADIGGHMLSGEAQEVFEEGMRIPIMKLFQGGAINRDLIDLLRANVRTPDETVGDIHAQVACNEVGSRNLLRFMDEFGLDSVQPLADEVIARSERALREAIRQLANGVYEHETWSDGFDEPIRIKVTVTVEDEDIGIDFTGSSPQSRHGINVVLNYTHAYASFAVKAAICPEVPHNEGSFRPVHISAPPGSILNCLEPAAVAGRHIIGHFLPCTIFGALARAMPDRVMASGAESIWISMWRGQQPGTRVPFTFTLFQCGGAGARAAKDGLSATGFPSGVAGVPAEAIETLSPLVLHRRGLRTDSGGAGRFRGGLGQWSEMGCRTDVPWSVSPLIDRTRFPGNGLWGGRPGAVGECLLATSMPLRPKVTASLDPGARVQLNPPGGGGYGDPFQRQPEAVLDDVVNGYVSVEGAARDYGVVVRYLGEADRLVRLPEQYAIDWPATEKLRARSAAL